MLTSKSVFGYVRLVARCAASSARSRVVGIISKPLVAFGVQWALTGTPSLTELHLSKPAEYVPLLLVITYTIAHELIAASSRLYNTAVAESEKASRIASAIDISRQELNNIADAIDSIDMRDLNSTESRNRAIVHLQIHQAQSVNVMRKALHEGNLDPVVAGIIKAGDPVTVAWPALAVWASNVWAVPPVHQVGSLNGTNLSFGTKDTLPREQTHASSLIRTAALRAFRAPE